MQGLWKTLLTALIVPLLAIPNSSFNRFIEASIARSEEQDDQQARDADDAPADGESPTEPVHPGMLAPRPVATVESARGWRSPVLGKPFPTDARTADTTRAGSRHADLARPAAPLRCRAIALSTIAPSIQSQPPPQAGLTRTR